MWRECGAAFDVAEGVDIFCGRFEFVVDVDEAVIIRGDAAAGRLRVSELGMRPGSDEQMRASRLRVLPPTRIFRWMREAWRATFSREHQAGRECRPL